VLGVIGGWRGGANRNRRRGATQGASQGGPEAGGGGDRWAGCAWPIEENKLDPATSRPGKDAANQGDVLAFRRRRKTTSRRRRRRRRPRRRAAGAASARPRPEGARKSACA
jgi:hypothetical protein